MTSVASPTIDQRVTYGAAWLDEHRPGWAHQINLDTLDLGDPCRCVLGQEWGDYFLAPDEVSKDVDLATWYGFERQDHETCAAEEAEYAELTRAWRTLILARRGGTS